MHLPAMLTFAPWKLAASSECISLSERGWKSSAGEAWLTIYTGEGGGIKLKYMYILEQNNVHVHDCIMLVRLGIFVIKYFCC